MLVGILKLGAESQVGEPAGKKAQQLPLCKLDPEEHVNVIEPQRWELYCSYPVSAAMNYVQCWTW